MHIESRLLYKTSKHLINKIEWIWYNDTEWIYCGLANDFKEELISKHIQEHFTCSALYVVLSRTGSYKLAFDEALPKIKELVNTHRFCVWNTELTKVIEFNSIGVFRKGTCAANTALPK